MINKFTIMKLKLMSFCLLFVAIFFSCKKEEISTVGYGNNGTIAIPLLSKVLVDNKSTYEYVYNDSNLVTDENSKFNYTTHDYNAKGQLVTTEYYGNDGVLSSDPQVYQTAMSSTTWVTPENGTIGGTMTYEYNDKGQIVKSTCSRPPLTCTEYSAFTYDSNNRISRQTMYWDGTATGYIDYSYDGNGNLIKEMLYNMSSAGVTELITTTQYNFDNQKNPYLATSILMIPGISTNKNNIIKETYTIHLSTDQGTDNAQVTETSYTYNKVGYPVTKNGNTSFIYI
jgi:hypothetical protein